jgi:hypothetical protein
MDEKTMAFAEKVIELTEAKNLTPIGRLTLCATIETFTEGFKKEIAELKAENERLEDALEDMVNQFADYGMVKGRLHITTMGLSALEHAFDVLGLDDPHPIPEHECQVKGCHRHATCGGPVNGKYIRHCGRHGHE